MSPEQCSGKDLDGRSDLYSFGCMMYEALSGQPPHVGETFINTIVKHISEKPKPISEAAPDAKVPPHVEAVVMRCLEKDPKDRYATAVELKQALYDAAFASGVKGLRFGAVPEPRAAATRGSGAPAPWGGASLSEKKVTRRWRMRFTVTIAVVAVGLISGGLWVFLYPGPDGDKGTIFNKMMWQRHLSVGDDNMKQQQYKDGVKELEQARAIANTIGDGKGRLETTLNKLSDAYGYVHDYASQEAVNKELAQISAERVLNEYDLLIALLDEWDKPTTSATINQERSLQAAAFAQRISLCAEKLFPKSRDKEILLLKKAIHTFDSLEAKEWKACVHFRVLLGECYRKQQRFDLLRAVLNDAIKMCPEKPPFAAGWRTKIQAMILLAQLDRNEAMGSGQLDHAREELEHCLEMTKQNLPNDKEMLRDIYSSLVVMNKLYHTKEYDEKALEYEKLSDSVKATDDSPDD
jgi:hypothetical protein